MENSIRIVSEAIILIFNLLIYMQLTVCKNNNLISKLIMYAVGIISVSVFFVVTCMNILPESSASAICVTIPSFIVFFILSKYKDFRFFVTFCFIDTVTLIFVFFIRTMNILLGNMAGIISTIIVTVLMMFIYVRGKSYFQNYRELISNVKDGWAPIAVSTSLIYFLLVFTAAYPKPLIQRIEYVPVYIILSLTVLSFYAVFLISIFQKKKLADLNARLIKERNWHRIAYADVLTGMNNRMAYVERINEFERNSEPSDIVYAIMIDVDNFKIINDTFGHHAGDLVLKSSAEKIKSIFSEDNYSTFRIGGDEFAVIAKNVTADVLQEKLDALKSSISCEDISVSMSIGYSEVNFEQKNSMENAFIRADMEMYANKSRLKTDDNKKL